MVKSLGGEHDLGQNDPTELQIRGSKGYFSIYFWKSALKIKLKGKNTLCSLRFQC